MKKEIRENFFRRMEGFKEQEKFLLGFFLKTLPCTATEEMRNVRTPRYLLRYRRAVPFVNASLVISPLFPLASAWLNEVTLISHFF